MNKSDQRISLAKSAWKQGVNLSHLISVSSLIDPFYFPFPEQERPCSLAHQWPLKVYYWSVQLLSRFALSHLETPFAFWSCSVFGLHPKHDFFSGSKEQTSWAQDSRWIWLHTASGTFLGSRKSPTPRSAGECWQRGESSKDLRTSFQRAKKEWQQELPFLEHFLRDFTSQQPWDVVLEMKRLSPDTLRFGFWIHWQLPACWNNLGKGLTPLVSPSPRWGSW